MAAPAVGSMQSLSYTNVLPATPPSSTHWHRKSCCGNGATGSPNGRTASTMKCTKMIKTPAILYRNYQVPTSTACFRLCAYAFVCCYYHSFVSLFRISVALCALTFLSWLVLCLSRLIVVVFYRFYFVHFHSAIVWRNQPIVIGIFW